MTDIIFQYWITAFFGFIVSGLCFVSRILWSKTQAVHGGVKILLYVEIKKYYYAQKKEDWCPLYVLEDVVKMHDQYKALGGNGALDSIMTEMRAMPKTND